MKIEEIVMHNIGILKEYQKAKGIENKYLSSSSFRSNLLRNGLPKIATIIELCKDFNIDSNDFFTKKLELKLIFNEIGSDKE